MKKGALVLLYIFFVTTSLFGQEKLETIIQTGQKAIYCGAFTLNGKYVATGSNNSNTVIIWDTESGKQLRNIRVGKIVYDVAFGSNENILITADEKGYLLYWNIQNGKLQKQINAQYSPGSNIIVSPNGKLIVSAGYLGNDNVVNVWDFETGNRLKYFVTHKVAKSITIGPKSNIIAAGLADSYIQIWDANTEKEIKYFSNIGPEVWDIEISPDSKYMGAVTYNPGSFGYNNTEVKIIDLNNNQVIHTIKPKIRQSTDIIFSPDSKTLLIVKDNFEYDKSENEIEWWDIQSGKMIKSVKKEIASNCSNMIRLSPDKKKILAFNKVREAKTGKLLQSLNKYKGHSELLGIKGITQNPVNNHILTIGNYNGTIQSWDLRKGKPISSIKAQYNGSMLKYSPNGKTLFIGNNQIIAIQELTLNPLKRGKTFVFNKNYISPFNFDLSKDGKTIVAIAKKFQSDEGGGDAIVWDVSTGSRIQSFENVSNGSFHPVIITRDADFIIVANTENKQNSGLIQIYNISTKEKVKEFKTETPISKIIMAPDGNSFLASSTKGEISIFKNYTWEKISGFNTKGNNSFTISSVVFAPDGNHIFIANYLDIEKYHIKTQKLVSTYKGHIDAISALAISKNGKQLFSGDRSGKVKIWNTDDSSSEVATLIYLEGIETLKVNSIGTRGTKTTPDKNGAYISRVIKNSSVYKAGVRNGDIITSFGGVPVNIASDYTNNLFRKHKPGDNVELVYKRNEQIINTRVIIEESIFKDRPNGKDDWAVILPDYHYMASKNIHKSVHFVKGLKYYNFENFDLIYNRPEIVIKKLGIANKDFLDLYKNAYNKRLNKMGFKGVQHLEDLSFPEVSINKSKIPKETSSDKIRLNIKAYSYNKNLDRLNIYINDIPVYGSKGLSISELKVKDFQKEVEIALSSGYNKIQVSVHNTSGYESIKETVEINCTKPKTKPNLYLITIGVSNYQNSDFNLSYAAKDAEDLGNIFKNNTKTYQDIKLLQYLNAKATKENILKVKQILMQSDINDEVILFVAGHGLLDENMDYYFATHDIDFYNPSQKGLKYELLESLLDGIPARKKLMLIDACHSGEIDKDTQTSNNSTALASIPKIENGSIKFRGFKNNKNNTLGLQSSFELMKELFADLRRGTGSMVISSASGVEFAYESDKWNNGVFTFSVLEAFRTQAADVNYDGNIQVSELRDYVTQRVSQLTSGKQHPTSRNENLEFDFKVW